MQNVYEMHLQPTLHLSPRSTAVSPIADPQE